MTLFEDNKTKKQYDSAYQDFLTEDVQDRQEHVSMRMQDPWQLNENGTVTISINESSITVSLKQWDFLKESVSFNRPFEEELEKYEEAATQIVENKTRMRDMLEDITTAEDNFGLPADYYQEPKSSLKQLLDEVMQDQEGAE